MKIVIELNDETYKEVIDRTEYDTLSLGIKLIEAVQNGTPLPKNHGRLIDADVLVEGMEDNYELCMEVNATPTIIPSERGEENDKH